MRKFKRMEPPARWPLNEARWNQQWVELLGKNPKATFSWYSHEGQTARDIALPYLKQQTVEHCSFCDGFPVECVSVDSIEHFRPKCAAGFPEHAYTWGNLYYCCGRCQSEKGDKWDEQLIAPDEPGYEFLRYFEFDFTTCAIRPSRNASEADQRRADATISAYGLDKPDRRRYRWVIRDIWRKLNAADRNLDVFAYRDFLSFDASDEAEGLPVELVLAAS